MQKIILNVLFLLFIGVTNASAQDSPMTQKPIISSSQDSGSLGAQWPAKGQDSTMSVTKSGGYYYYPSTNVYYNDASQEYMYYDSASTKWKSGKTLPSTLVMDKKSDRFPFPYTGTEPWKENSTHKVKYKVKKDGTIKMKTKD